MNTDPTSLLSSIQSRSFRTSAQADAELARLAQRFGFTKRYTMARLALGLSLSDVTPPLAISGDTCRGINGEDLFGIGEDLATWAALIIGHARPSTPPTLPQFAEWVERHWARGQTMLSSLWQQSDSPHGELEALFRALAQRATPGDERDPGVAIADPEQNGTPAPLMVQLGPIAKDMATGEVLNWVWNRSVPHVGVLGRAGSGKTEFTLGLIKQLRTQAKVPVIFVDPQGQIARDKPDFVAALQATVLEVKDTAIPLDLLKAAPGEDDLAVAERFCDSFAATFGGSLGALQRPAFLDALLALIRQGNKPALQGLTKTLTDAYAAIGKRPDGLLGKVDILNRRALFTPEQSASQFFAKSWILSLQNATEDRTKLTMLLLLDALQGWSNGLREAPTDAQGHRMLRCILVIDEARRVLQLGSESLMRLIREARQKGVAVVLMSQDAEDFETDDANFLANMGLVAAFVCQSNPTKTLRNHLSDARLNALPEGQAKVRLAGESTARTVQVWQR